MAGWDERLIDGYKEISPYTVDEDLHDELPEADVESPTVAERLAWLERRFGRRACRRAS